jgi:hypothetical protein
MQTPRDSDKLILPVLNHLANSSIFTDSGRNQSNANSIKAMPVPNKTTNPIVRTFSPAKPNDILIPSGGRPKLKFEQTEPNIKVDNSFGEGPQQENHRSGTITPGFDIPNQ